MEGTHRVETAMPTMVQEPQPRTRKLASRLSDTRPGRDVPIDWAHLTRFTLNDTSLEQEVLGLFAMDAPRYLAKMQSAASTKDWVEAAHTLKGSARAVGAWTVAECAQAAEALQKTAQIEHSNGPFDPQSNSALKAALEQLGEAVRITLAYINRLHAESAKGKMPRPA